MEKCGEIVFCFGGGGGKRVGGTYVTQGCVVRTHLEGTGGELAWSHENTWDFSEYGCLTEW